MQKIAEILATGDEIRSGALVDSNSAWIAERLEETGIRVTRHACVGDELPQLVAELLEIGRRADLAVVTGGLGPTSDDLTAQAAAGAVGRPTRLFPEALAAIEAFFQRKNRSMPASNTKQAMLPERAEIIENPVGTAPGFSLEIEGCLFFFLPGVPREMQIMCRESVLPAVRRFLGPQPGVMKTRTLSSFGLTESRAADALAGFEDRFPSIKLGFRALFPEIQVKLYLHGERMADIENLELEAVPWLKQRIGESLISETGETLPMVVGRLLSREGATVALAESCTGGLAAHWLTSHPGSSAYFLLAAVTYADTAKHRVLGVSEDTLATLGAVSEATALEMARGVRDLAAADYGLSITGVAGPGGGSPEKPVGCVCFGLAGPDISLATTRQFHFENRHQNQSMAAAYSLDLLRRQLLKTHS